MKICFFADDVILYTEYSNRNHLKLINIFGKVVIDKIIILGLVTFLY